MDTVFKIRNNIDKTLEESIPYTHIRINEEIRTPRFTTKGTLRFLISKKYRLTFKNICDKTLEE